MRVERLDHVHIHVRDLDKTVSFFSGALGMKFSPQAPFEPFNARWAASPVGIILTSPVGPGPVAKTLDRQGEGLVNIALKVSDVEEAKAHLAQRGVHPVEAFSYKGISEAHYHPRDTFGVRVELLQ
ncbi:VOC family protein, partial [Chloroflexota bacterium]